MIIRRSEQLGTLASPFWHDWRSRPLPAIHGKQGVAIYSVTAVHEIVRPNLPSMVIESLNE